MERELKGVISTYMSHHEDDIGDLDFILLGCLAWLLDSEKSIQQRMRIYVWLVPQSTDSIHYIFYPHGKNGDLASKIVMEFHEVKSIEEKYETLWE
jgi:hypothetical protein